MKKNIIYSIWSLLLFVSACSKSSHNSTPQLSEMRIGQLVPCAPSNVNAAIPSKKGEMMTKDPAIIELFANWHPPIIGELKPGTNGKWELYDGERLLFTASEIGDLRSKASDNTIALDAIIGEVSKEAEVPLPLRSVWIIRPNGASVKISPDGINAFSPLISPDGDKVAFTGQAVDKSGVRSEQKLYVKSIMSGECLVIQGEDGLDDIHLGAVDWQQQGKILRVIQDHGETGGHMKLKQVRVE